MWVHYAIISGVLAACGSLFGKFSTSEKEALIVYRFSVDSLELTFTEDSVMITIIRIGFFVLMILSNVVMWTFFTRALSTSSTTIEVIICNTAMNFFTTAVFGQVFFEERLSYLWWIGSLFIISGLCLVHKGNENIKQQAKKD